MTDQEIQEIKKSLKTTKTLFYIVILFIILSISLATHYMINGSFYNEKQFKQEEKEQLKVIDITQSERDSILEEIRKNEVFSKKLDTIFIEIEKAKKIEINHINNLGPDSQFVYFSTWIPKEG